MFFETVEHELVECSDARQAALWIKGKETITDRQSPGLWQVPVWTAPNGHTIAAVADNVGADDAWGEAAIIDLTTNKQIESITVAWCDVEELVEYFTTVHDSEIVMKNPADLPMIGAVRGTAHFQCGCCGDDFESTIAEQKRFDRDAGYGICDDCAPRHY
jgi:hypothetical protein